jgi:P27 family predicted phage terminase small subunit
MKTTSNKLPKAPKSLSAEAKVWWRKILADYELDHHGLLLLESALQSFDRMRQAQALLDKEGIVLTDRFEQKKPHPATVIERDSKAAMVRTFQALHLDIEPLHDKPGRPLGT